MIFTASAVTNEYRKPMFVLEWTQWYKYVVLPNIVGLYASAAVPQFGVIPTIPGHKPTILGHHT